MSSRVHLNISVVTPKVPSGRRNLIVSAAQTYAETFLKAPNGQPYLFEMTLNAPDHFPLTEAIFNATEYRTGNSFRFQRSRTGHSGNRFMTIPKDEAKQIRVADIVAASSCLPGTFEPLAFPDDFAWPMGTVPPKTREIFSEECENGGRRPRSVPLMDGGIYDNQGLANLLLADKRLHEPDQGELDPDELALIIVSDADCKEDDIYPYPTAAEGTPLGSPGRPRGISLGTANIMAKAVMGACALTVAVIAAHVWQDTGSLSGWDLFLYSVSLALAGFVAGGMWWGRRQIGDYLGKIPQTEGVAWQELARIGVHRILDCVSLRLTSISKTSDSVMPKRVRDLSYQYLYSHKRYQKKRVSNLIYHLQSGQKFNKDLKAVIREPSSELQRVIDAAATMDTRFWFEHKYEIPCLLSCGQATICYNSMKFIDRNYKKHKPDEIQRLWTQLVDDWGRLRNDPYSLSKERQKTAGLANEKWSLPPSC